MDESDVIVVGSGPAGVSAASALLERGRRVLMLDIGTPLHDAADRAHTLKSLSPEAWPKDVLKDIHHLPQTYRGVPLKRYFGSDAPYRESETYLPLRLHGVATTAASGAGGLSTIWGAAVLPYSQEDMTGWPIDVSDLAPHYKAVTKFFPIAANNDDVQGAYPLYASPGELPPEHPQIHAFAQDLRTHRSSLAVRGIMSEAARLALHTGCKTCGLCLYGCPYGIIYSSLQTLESLKQHPRFSYMPRMAVRRLREHDDLVDVEIMDIEQNTHRTLRARRVFLAAGVFPTTAILLSSRNMFGTAITLMDSATWYFPLLRRQRAPVHLDRDVYTLVQRFLTLHHPTASPHPIHVQVYPLSRLHVSSLRSTGLAWLLSRQPLEFLTGRLLIAGGYLHSHDSPRIHAQLEREGETTSLRLTATEEPRTRLLRKEVHSMLRAARKWTGAVPLPQFARVLPAGRSFHTGGAFPMRTRPDALESDILGRPFGWSRVHAVDATVFPTIPANTITYAVMANAHRIASEAPADPDIAHA